MSKHVTVELRLDFDHRNFTAARSKEFIAAVALIGACKPSEISIISVESGCTIVTAKMPPAAARRISERLYELVHAIANASGTRPQVADEALGEAEQKVFGDFQLKAILFEVRRRILPKTYDRAIAFVPGWSKAEKPFGNWPAILWNEWNARRGLVRVPVFPYSQKSDSLEVLAKAFREWLGDHAPRAQIGIVAHSVGGLIARKMLVAESEKDVGIDARVISLAFVASPHEMAQFARDAGSRLPDLSAKQKTAMRAEARAVEALQPSWQLWLRNSVPNHCAIESYVPAEDQVITSPANPSGPHEKVTEIFDRDHLSVVQVISGDEQLPQRYRGFLGRSGFFEEREASDEERKRVTGQYWKKSSEEANQYNASLYGGASDGDSGKDSTNRPSRKDEHPER